MVQVSCRYVIQVLRYDKIFTPHFMDIYHSEHVYGAIVSMGNSEDKNSSILVYNSGLEKDMKFKLSPVLFSQSKDYSCVPFMCFLHDFNFRWKLLLRAL